MSEFFNMIGSFLSSIDPNVWVAVGLGLYGAICFVISHKDIRKNEERENELQQKMFKEQLEMQRKLIEEIRKNNTKDD